MFFIKKILFNKLIYFYITQSFDPFLLMISGFEVVNKGCCGTGNIEVSVLCNRLEDAHTCPDASKYVFWDSYHPTEAAYKILSNQVLSKVKDKFF